MAPYGTCSKYFQFQIIHFTRPLFSWLQYLDENTWYTYNIHMYIIQYTIIYIFYLTFEGALKHFCNETCTTSLMFMLTNLYIIQLHMMTKAVLVKVYSIQYTLCRLTLWSLKGHSACFLSGWNGPTYQCPEQLRLLYPSFLYRIFILLETQQLIK